MLCLPFGLSVARVSPAPRSSRPACSTRSLIAGGGYPYLTVNAYNPWAIVPGDTGMSLANSGLWVCDAVRPDAERCGAGVAQFGASRRSSSGRSCCWRSIGAILWVVARRPDRLTILVGLAILALAFFAVPTRVHERYGYPFFALGAILAAVSLALADRLRRPGVGDVRRTCTSS